MDVLLEHGQEHCWNTQLLTSISFQRKYVGIETMFMWLCSFIAGEKTQRKTKRIKCDMSTQKSLWMWRATVSWRLSFWNTHAGPLETVRWEGEKFSQTNAMKCDFHLSPCCKHYLKERENSMGKQEWLMCLSQQTLLRDVVMEWEYQLWIRDLC